MSPRRRSRNQARARAGTRTRLCAEQGIDFEQLVDERKREEDILRAAGITLGAPAPAAPAAPAAAQNPAEPADDDEDEVPACLIDR